MWSTLLCIVGMQSVQYSREAKAAKQEAAQLRATVIVPDDLLKQVREELAKGKWAEEIAGKDLPAAVLKHKVLAVYDNFAVKTIAEHKSRVEEAARNVEAQPKPQQIKIELK
jgi:hypothetical protein